MTTLFLVRHGQAGALDGQYDILSELGWTQAERLGNAWSKRGLALDEVWCGTLQRQKLTLDALSPAIRKAAPVWHDPALDELPFEQLATQFSTQYPDHSAASHWTKANDKAGFKALMEHAISAWQCDQLDGVEPVWSTYRSALANWLEGRRLAATDDGTLLAISSAGSISLLLAIALDLPDAAMSKFNSQLFNTAVSALHLTANGETRLLLYNSVAHLEDPVAPELITTL